MSEMHETRPSDAIAPTCTIDSPAPSSSSTFPTTLADLNFTSSTLDNGAPVSNRSIYKTLDSLRKSTLSIPNRLRSVLEDAEFVEALWEYLNDFCPLNDITSCDRPDNASEDENEDIGNDDNDKDINDRAKAGVWPLIPNERSGSWPLDLDLKIRSQHSYLASSSTSLPTAAFAAPTPSPAVPISAYFKSTDGHINQWSFSLRRLNLPVLSILSSGGVVLVDTTRRGKSYPDALRRTVPIYTAVWNRVLFPELLHTGVCDFQPCALDASETSQIEARIPKFVSGLMSLNLDLKEIKKRVQRPIRCVWITAPSTGKQAWESKFEELVETINNEQQKWLEMGGVSILVCCSASRRVMGVEMSEEGYIQGSGDDSEGWSLGLTAGMFWENKERLMTAVDEGGDVEEIVRRVVEDSKKAGGMGQCVLIRPTTNLFSGANGNEGVKEGFDLVVDCNATAIDQSNSKVLCLGCKDGKLGSKLLREKLPEVKKKAEELLRKNSDVKILLSCSTGKDLSIGVVLVLLCIFCSDDGKCSKHMAQVCTNIVQEESSSTTSPILTKTSSSSGLHGSAHQNQTPILLVPHCKL